MKTIRTKVYQFGELNADAKQKAIEWYLSNDYDNFAWDNTIEDAEQIGLRLITLDDHSANKGEFITNAEQCARAILDNHGKDCDTYKTASIFIDELQVIKDKAENEGKDGDEDYWYDDEIEDLENEFMQSILEDYRIIYNHDLEYQQSESYAIENIIANEYDFTKDGKRFNQ